MDQAQTHQVSRQVVSIPRGDRWLVYQRLQELGIPCSCSSDGYLHAEAKTPTAAIQLWSVVRQSTASRRELIFWLHRCKQFKI